MPWSSQAVIAQLVLIEGTADGLFVYDSSGNLIGSIANTADIDPNTSSNQVGIVSYGGTDQFVQMNSDEIEWGTTNPSSKIAVGAVGVMIDVLNTLAQPILRFSSPRTSTAPATSSYLSLLGQSGNASLPPQIIAGTTGAVAGNTSALVEVQGTLAADSLWVPSADLPVGAAPAGAETWHGLTALTYQNSWADSGTNIPGRYRIVGSPPRSVEIEGDLTVGTVADGTLIVTLPANYQPVHSQIIRLVVPAGTPTNPGNMRLTVGTDGTIKCTALAGLASPNRIYFHDFISLD